jgi:hypothetical protein
VKGQHLIMSEHTNNETPGNAEPVDPAAPQSNAPSAEAVSGIIEWIARELQGLVFGCQNDLRSPERWPHLAAKLQLAGTRMADTGAQLAASLAAYAEAHPSIEVPDDGPSVLLLSSKHHEQFWREANNAEALQDIQDGARRYGEALTVQYGRPDLAFTAVALDAQAAGDVMVKQYVAELGPDAVVRVFLGGHVTESQTAAAELLDQHGISAGALRFWPPLWPDRTFISVPGCADLFDAYGRVVDPSVPS